MKLNKHIFDSLPEPEKIFIQLIYWEHILFNKFKDIPYWPEKKIITFNPFINPKFKEFFLLKTKNGQNKEYKSFKLMDALENLFSYPFRDEELPLFSFEEHYFRYIRFFDVIKFFLAYDGRKDLKYRIASWKDEFLLDFYVNEDYSLYLRSINKLKFIHEKKNLSMDITYLYENPTSNSFPKFFESKVNEYFPLINEFINNIVKDLESLTERTEYYKNLLFFGGVFLTQDLIRDLIYNFLRNRYGRDNLELENLFFISLFNNRCKIAIKKEVLNLFFLCTWSGIMNQKENALLFYNMYGRYILHEIEDAIRERIYLNLGYDYTESIPDNRYGSIEYWTKAQLTRFCNNNNIKIRSSFTKKEIIEKIKKSELSKIPRLRLINKIVADEMLFESVVYEFIKKDDIENILINYRLTNRYFLDFKRPKARIPALIYRNRKVKLIYFHTKSEMFLNVLERYLAKYEKRIKEIIKEHNEL